jgi:light-regulated signal transduction histidine kinase (bacteriophytochrome)
MSTNETIDAIDFIECESERLDAPGAIQPFGFLLAFDRGTLRLTHASSSAFEALGPRKADWLGENLKEVLTFLGVDAKAVSHCFEISRKQGLMQPLTLAVHGRYADMVSAGPQHLLFERRISDFEISTQSALDEWKAALDLNLHEVEASTFEIAQKVSSQIRELIGFDRVMIYRFEADWSGEVIADSYEPDMPSYLGLHFPATDIPSQARKLYLTCRIREIADTSAPAISIEPKCRADDSAPLDLSPSVLRAISPYHLRYMQNLGIVSTLVLSLVADGKLWGLIACHHRRRRVLPLDLRNAASYAAERLSERLESIIYEKLHKSDEIVRGFIELIGNASKDDRDGIRPMLENAIIAADADGAVLISGENIVAMGATPKLDGVIQIVDKLPPHEEPFLLETPPALLYGCFGNSKGLAAVSLPTPQRSMLLLFREEFVRSVSWGGDPRRAAERDESTGKLSPRKSFAVWMETVRGRSKPWGLNAVKFLSAIVKSAIAKEISEKLASLENSNLFQEFSDIASIRLLLDGIPDPVILVRTAVDNVPVSMGANAQFRRAYLDNDETVEGRKLQSLLSHIRLSLPYEKIDQVVMATTWSHRDGLRDVEVQRSTLISSSIAGYQSKYEMLILRDRTKETRAERTKALALHYAEELGRAKSQLLANMSHELRTPLNAILGYAEMMALSTLGVLGHPKYVEYTQDIISAGRHLLDLIDRVLTAAQLDAGKRQIEEANVNLVEAVDAAVEWTRVATVARAPQIETLSPQGGVNVRGDQLALKQIAINLIANAVKFSGPNGVVRAVVALNPLGEPMLQVIDDGPGVSGEHAEGMFSEFQQGEEVYSRQHGGVGLGLAIVKALVDMHGGRVSLSNRAEGGAVATVVLPKHRLLH